MLKKPRVAIIDYDMGNLFSVQHVSVWAGMEPIVTYDRAHILEADAAILPGVGAFGDAMSKLEKLGLVSVIHEFVKSGKPVLGICLGMQLLLDESEEFGSTKGLGLISGKVKKIPMEHCGKKMKIPQIQWNQIFPPDKNVDSWKKTSLAEIKSGEYMYFIHSYFADPVEKSNILCSTIYEGLEYTSGIIKNNITAFQFHPEKSAKEGLKIYKTWADSIQFN